jgi:raffinose/stachyose/melibiose transport system substrate-binding protein
MKNAKFFLVLLVGMLVLSACAPTATPTAVQPPTAVPPTAVVPPTVIPPTAEPVTLVYWSMWNADEPMGVIMAQAIKAFETANPNVTIEVTWQGRPGRNLFAPAIDAGTVIDLVDQDTGRIALTWGDKYILGLDSYLSQPSIGVKDKTVSDTIFPILMNQYKTAGGSVASIPYNPYINLWFYNKAHFQAAGITKVPTTFDEWMTDNAALKAAGHGKVFTYDPDYYTDVMAGDSVQRYVGCEAFKTALIDKTGESWKSAGLVQWAKDMAALSEYAAPGTNANLYPAGQQAFALGDVTMTFNGTWLPSEVKDTAGPDFPWGAFSWPAVTNGVGTINDYDMGSQGMAITKVSKHADVAFEFIKYVVSLDTQTAAAAKGFASSLVDIPWTGPIADAYPQMKNAKTGFGWACEGWNTGDFFGTNLMPAFTDLITGKVTADAFTARMVSEAKKMK